MAHDHDHHWERELLAMRDSARHHFKHQFDWRGSPVPEGFDGPRYFDPDPRWTIEATLDREAPRTGEHVQLATSTGTLRDMQVAGQLVLDTPLGEKRLTAFRTPPANEEDDLFLPFQDATSGTETYGSGRYLEVPLLEDGTYLVDFNFAYNPSCAYSPTYDCPYPPPGNRLDIPVPAGEKVPFDP